MLCVADVLVISAPLTIATAGADQSNASWA
jgi:hypothetical protein